MKNKLISFVTSLTLSCTAVGSMQIESKADNGLYGYKLTADMSSCKCFYPNEIAGQYGFRIMRGATSWQISDNLDFNLNWSRTTDSLDRTACVLTYNAPDDGFIAYTEFYYIDYNVLEQCEPKNRNWDNCIIRINTAYNNYLTYSTMTHEFGHVMGLSHMNYEPSSIMCQIAEGRTATEPSVADIVRLNSLY